jgi:TonB family protein
MRPLSCVALALAILLSSAAEAQTASSQATPPQTARQALIEMLVGQSPDHLERHLPDVTRQVFERLGGQNNQMGLGLLSVLAAEAKGGRNKVETFDTGTTLLTAEGPIGGPYQKVDITVERDDLVGGEDEIELALHMSRDGKEETLPFLLRFTFSMKMESDIWRLNEVSVAVRVPLADPAFLKSLEERQLQQNEQTAIWSVRSVVAAQKSYQSARGGFACTLSALGSAGKEAGVARHVYLYDSQLVGGKKNGYTFAVTGCDASHYHLVAEPAVRGSGQRAFCSDESGTVHASVDGKAATCLASGEVVEEKVPAGSVREAGASGQSNGGSSPPTNATIGPGGTTPRVRVSQGVASGLIISKAQPIYPQEARSARIQGTVVMKAVINQLGDVVSLDLVSGHPLLAPAALDAVKQWKYRPYLLNGNAVEVETQITVNFTLSGG